MNHTHWHDMIMKEECPTMLKCLEEQRLFSVERTEHGFHILELCDYYFETTLTPEQMRRLIGELQQLLDEPAS